jgi:hypothetical protein
MQAKAVNARLCLHLADLVLVLHALWVGFVVLGLVIIWCGHLWRWPFVRNFYFRLAHLLAIGFVAITTLFGIDCPLTVWENQLRWIAGGGARYQGSFIQYWLHQILFYEASADVFKVVYGGFFLLVVGSLLVVKPHPPGQTIARSEPGNARFCRAMESHPKPKSKLD